MEARVLIVEDDPDIADLISLYLKREGIETLHAATGEAGLALVETGNPDLMVLDINLPGIDGFQTLAKTRRISPIPVIVVSARQEDADMLLAFGAGSDDYVTKPFSPRVLVARIRAHLERLRQFRGDAPQGAGNLGPEPSYLLHRGDLTVNTLEKTVRLKGDLVHLPPRELELLLFLAGRPGQSHTQEELYRELWSQDYGDLSTVSIHIQRLRRRIEAEPSKPSIIKTRHGLGYYFVSQEEW